MSRTPIDLEENEGGNLPPIMRRQVLGQTAVLAFAGKEARDQRDQEGNPVPHATKPGKIAQELVLTAVVMPGTTMIAGKGDDEWVPEPGDVVRTIFKGKAYGEWIEATNALSPKYRIGDVIEQTLDSAVVYAGKGDTGKPLADQAAVVAAKMKGKTVGIYGPVTVRRATDAEDPWVEKAEDAYREGKAIDLPDEAPASLV